MSKSKKIEPRKKISLKLFHHRLRHRYTISLLAGDTADFFQDIEIRIDPKPLFTSCQISLMNKKARSKNPLKPKERFKWVFMDIIPATSPKCLTSETIFSNYILIVDVY